MGCSLQHDSTESAFRAGRRDHPGTAAKGRGGGGIDIQRLLADLRKCCLGGLSPAETAQFSALCDDFVECHRNNPDLIYPADLDDGQERERTYWQGYLAERTALQKGSMGCIISATMDVDALDFGLPRGDWSAAEIAASIIVAVTQLVKKAGEAQRSNRAGSDEMIVLAAANCRLPAIDHDTIECHSGSNHWCVFAHGDIYRLDLPEMGGAATYAAVVSTIDAMIFDEGERVPNLLPAITAVDRPEAARLRDELMQDQDVADTIATIESALGIIVIDRTAHEPTGVAFQRNLMAGNGLDRWFGKTNFVVSGRQWGGIQLDHGSFNGLRGQRFLELLLAATRTLHRDRAKSRGAVRYGPHSFSRLSLPPMRRAVLDRIFSAYHASGQLASVGTVDGRLLSFANATQPEITGYLTVAAQLAMAGHRGAVPDAMMPVRRLDGKAGTTDHLRAAFPSTARLSADWRATGRLDPALLAKSISDWRYWFRRAVVGNGIEWKLDLLKRRAAAAGVDHPLFQQRVLAKRTGGAPVFLTFMPAREAVGASIYLFPPLISASWSIGAYIGPGAVRFDVASGAEEAGEVASDIKNLMTQMYRLRDRIRSEQAHRKLDA